MLYYLLTKQQKTILYNGPYTKNENERKETSSVQVICMGEVLYIYMFNNAYGRGQITKCITKDIIGYALLGDVIISKRDLRKFSSFILV